jgi:predicted Zn finger-like uncharacterized protein
MFTVCPKCALTLVVTAADLRVAQGYVRCGRCLNVFNALARLSEERPAAAPGPPDTTAAGSPEQAPAPPQPPAPSFSVDDTGEIEIELDASVVVTDARAPAAPEGSAEPKAHSPAPGPTPPVPHTSQSAPAATAITETSEQSAESSPPAEAPEAQQTNTPQQQPEDTFALETRRPRAGLAWKLGAGALVIALALQIVNHYRDNLAADPALTGPLSTVYSALGVKLAPRWNIHAYDVRQLGASVAGTAAGEIVVRASVKNSASRAQPLPLLRVTLQDRFGNRIAARDVPPSDYLPSSVAPSSLLTAGGRVDATMVFVDPGPQAVGFEIDACLRQQSGEVACAHGP